MTNESSTLVTSNTLISFAEFLESVPPSTPASIKDVRTSIGAGTWRLHTPEIKLHCSDKNCNGSRFFRFTGTPISLPFDDEDDNQRNLYLVYQCWNCQNTTKTFALLVGLVESNKPGGICFKYGEAPVYGPPTPSRLLRLLDDDREMFLKGRRCENQGLGVGAFAYYRRVVENQRSRIFEEIIRVSEKLRASPEMINTLRAAQQEIQFNKSMKSVKDAIPAALLINGQNPITLLHSALSVGLHTESDEICLQFAHAARLVLIELADRLGQALKDEAELNNAVKLLQQAHQGSGNQMKT